MPRGWQIGAHARAADGAGGGARAGERAGAPRRGIRDRWATSRRSRCWWTAGREAAPARPEAAGRWLLAATRLLPPNDGERRRLSLLAEAASALTFAGAYDEALAVLDEAAATCCRASASTNGPGWSRRSRWPSA